MAQGEIKLIVSPVKFTEESHEYWLGDKQLQGMTSTLIHRAFPHALENIPQEILDKAAERGHAIHDDLMNIERWGNLPTTIEAENYIYERSKMGLRCIESEYIISDEEHYASAIDNVSVNNDDEICLIDYKTFYQLDAERKQKVTLQLNLYKMFFERQNPGLKVGHLYVAWFRETSDKSHHEFIELPIIDKEKLEALINADINDDQTYEYNPLPAWMGDFELKYREVLKRKEAIDEEIDQIKQDLFDNIKECGQESLKGTEFTVTYIPATEAQRLDTTALKKNEPDIFKKYQKTSIVKASIRITQSKR